MRTRKERGPTRARNDQTDMDESTVLVQRKKERGGEMDLTDLNKSGIFFFRGGQTTTKKNESIVLLFVLLNFGA